MTHPNFRLKLEAIGFGFLIPIFFIASGISLDLRALFTSPSAALKVPLFLAALLIVRGLPALLYVPLAGRTAASAAALLQATSLPFIVAATALGLLLKLVVPSTAAALVAAGVLSVLFFPPAALALLRRQAPASGA
jgi:Kef-type K+ transport system membrane component KefB